MSDAPYVLEIAVEAKGANDRERMETFLRKYETVDTRFRTTVDSESGLVLICGPDEAVLDSVIDILVTTAGFHVNVGAPQVAYRETLSRQVTVRYTHKRALGGAGQYADVMIEFGPLPAGRGFEFESAIAKGMLADEFVRGVEKGIRAQKESGLVAGFPVVDFKARLVDATYHEIDSSPMVFDIAARAAFRDIAKQGVAVLLEPLMNVLIVTPDDFSGATLGDLNSRRARIESVDSMATAPVHVIRARVPLLNMFSYGQTLKAMTQDRGKYAMRFDHYGPVDLPDGGDDTFPPAVGMRA
jgi:elongation factor G